MYKSLRYMQRINNEDCSSIVSSKQLSLELCRMFKYLGTAVYKRRLDAFSTLVSIACMFRFSVRVKSQQIRVSIVETRFFRDNIS